MKPPAWTRPLWTAATSLPVLAPVAALAVLAVLMSQAVTFAVVVLSPEPRPAGFTISAAAEALQGRPATTADGRKLTRHLSAHPIGEVEAQRGPDGRIDPLASALAATLAERLNVPTASVRIRVDRSRPRFPFSRPQDRGPRPFGGPGPGAAGPETVQSRVIKRGVHAQTSEESAQSGWPVERSPPPGRDDRRFDRETTIVGGPPGVAMGGLMGDGGAHPFTILADRIMFDPFSASLKLPDGRWATVEPPHSLISPWQMRLLASLAISLLILAPIVWWLANRLTRPIRAFAAAAERLGADPDAEPLTPTGPTEVRTAIAAFNDMQASLKGHMRRRTQTIAAIAHDLRTPLTRLRFRAEQAPEILRDRMVGDVEEMDTLISQAMAFVRGETEVERHETLDLGALARDCVAGFSETGAAVSWSGTINLPIEGDPAALRRAVANLIENAVKFTGGARVSGLIEGTCAIVQIDDDGPGLAEDELESVFEPFARGEGSRNRGTGGAGLGLAVARQAARAAGGDVTLANRPGGGLTVTLSLPLAPA